MYEGDIFGELNREMFNRRWPLICYFVLTFQLVTLIGKAGTGKTLLALATGLMQTEDLAQYKKLLVARPIVPVGKDIGYLPGEKEEKLDLGCNLFLIICNICSIRKNQGNWMLF